MWPYIPEDVIEYVRMVIRSASDKTTEHLTNQPNTREMSLDDVLVTAVARFSAPKRLTSNTIVTLQVHNIGGLRQWNKWELADIAFIVHVYSDEHPIAQKIGLLQSKRLYPKNNSVDADDPIAFMYGLNDLIGPPETTTAQFRETTYDFTEQSVYGAISHDDEQLKRIVDFHEGFGESVFYLLYHPPEIPFQHTFPAVNYQSVCFPPLGPQVVQSATIRKILDDPSRPKRSPNFKEVRSSAGNDYWRLEKWAADLLLQCKVGRQYSKSDHDLIKRLIHRRTGPIGAAIQINIGLSEIREVLR